MSDSGSCRSSLTASSFDSPNRKENHRAKMEAREYLEDLEGKIDQTQMVLREIFSDKNQARQHKKINNRQNDRLVKYKEELSESINDIALRRHHLKNSVNVDLAQTSNFADMVLGYSERIEKIAYKAKERERSHRRLEQAFADSLRKSASKKKLRKGSRSTSNSASKKKKS